MKQPYSDGYRIFITALDEVQEVSQCLHWCGGKLEGDTKEVPCPNCERPLFPLFKFNMNDEQLAKLNLWSERFLQILVCPACTLYMKPYWVCFNNENITVAGGDKGRPALLNVELPYETRPLKLEKLRDSELPTNERERIAYLNRTMPPGVYHQIGGQPTLRQIDPLECCNCSQRMRFAGIVDYDDLNVPLYEMNHCPLALIIGDSDRLYFFTCKKCSVVGFTWVK